MPSLTPPVRDAGKKRGMPGKRRNRDESEHHHETLVGHRQSFAIDRRWNNENIENILLWLNEADCFHQRGATTGRVPPRGQKKKDGKPNWRLRGFPSPACG